MQVTDHPFYSHNLGQQAIRKRSLDHRQPRVSLLQDEVSPHCQADSKAQSAQNTPVPQSGTAHTPTTTPHPNRQASPSRHTQVTSTHTQLFWCLILGFWKQTPWYFRRKPPHLLGNQALQDSQAAVLLSTLVPDICTITSFCVICKDVVIAISELQTGTLVCVGKGKGPRLQFFFPKRNLAMERSEHRLQPRSRC